MASKFFKDTTDLLAYHRQFIVKEDVPEIRRELQELYNKHELRLERMFEEMPEDSRTVYLPRMEELRKLKTVQNSSAGQAVSAGRGEARE